MSTFKAVVSIALLTFALSPTHAIEEGEVLPVFHLQDLTGRDHTPQTHTGQVLILYFFGHD